MERHAVARLIGAPPGYVGYEEGGQLTERVRRRPYSVILLDEIEKAHADVYNVLLQVFDDGRLTDGKGRVVDFTNTLIIATSNLASDVIMQDKRPVGFVTKQDKVEESVRGRVMSALRQHFRPEFLNRIDEIIIFHALDRTQIKSIVEMQLQRVKQTAHGQDITLDFDDSLINHLAETGYQPEFGARELKRQIRQSLESKLAKAMLRGEVTEGAKVRCAYDEAKQDVTFAISPPDAGDGQAKDVPPEAAKPASKSRQPAAEKPSRTAPRGGAKSEDRSKRA
jgi:ATP-dependent Clp protease ATP-binding subunit ClpC